MIDLQMLPLRYPWAHDRTMEMLQNTWLPAQVNTAQDNLGYATLPAEEKAQFQIALANLSTADVQIMDQISSGFTEIIRFYGIYNAPEIRNLLAVMESQEALHNISYQHILESVLHFDQKDANAIYGMYKTKPALGDKVEYCAMRDEGACDPSEKPYYRTACALYRPLIYEGVLFMNGFNPLFWFPQFRKTMLGTAEQLQYIRRDETLHIHTALQIWQEGILPQLDFTEIPPIARALHDFIHKTEDLEENFIYYVLGGGKRIGLNPQSYMDHFKHLCQLRCLQAGLGDPYPGKKFDPLPWVDEVAGLRKEKNFFETHVIEYRSGADLWKDEES